MADARPRILTDEQRLWLTTIPPDLSSKELVRYYTLSPDDIAFIQGHYKDENRLGIAVQLCGLRYPGRRLVDLETNFFRVLTRRHQQLRDELAAAGN